MAVTTVSPARTASALDDLKPRPAAPTAEASDILMPDETAQRQSAPEGGYRP